MTELRVSLPGLWNDQAHVPVTPFWKENITTALFSRSRSRLLPAQHRPLRAEGAQLGVDLLRLAVEVADAVQEVEAGVDHPGAPAHHPVAAPVGAHRAPALRPPLRAPASAGGGRHWV